MRIVERGEDFVRFRGESSAEGAEIRLLDRGVLVCHGKGFFFAFRFPQGGWGFLGLVRALAKGRLEGAIVEAGQREAYSGEEARSEVRDSLEEYDEGSEKRAALAAMAEDERWWGDDLRADMEWELLRIEPDSWEWQIGWVDSPELARAREVAREFLGLVERGFPKTREALADWERASWGHYMNCEESSWREALKAGERAREAWKEEAGRGLDSWEDVRGLYLELGKSATVEDLEGYLCLEGV